MDEHQEAVRQAVRERVRKARAHGRAQRPAEPVPLLASCAVLGCTYGIGIGLYFKTLQWLQWMFAGLALVSAAYVAMVNCGTWTSSTLPALRWHGANPPGWASLQLHRLTFAMLMDDRRDLGGLDVLQVPSGVGQHVNDFPRKSFLQGIAAADAISVALCLLAFLYMTKLAGRYVADVKPRNSARASDFTILVRGLPDVTPADVAQHFGRWGQVMDVVVVKDCAAVLRLAAEASRRDAKRRAAQELVAHNAGRAHLSAAIKAERKLEDFMVVANDRLSRTSASSNRVALVTFNTMQEKAACLAQSPQSWLGCLFQAPSQRLLQQHRFWTQQAQPPEDYRFENINDSWLGRMLRWVVVRIVVLAFLLLSCLVVTKLMSINTDMANTIRWNMTALQSNISSAMRTYPANTTANQPLGSAIDATRFASSHTGPVDSRSPWGPFQASVAATYCNSHLPGTCQAALNNPYIMNGIGPITLRLGQLMQWSQPKDRFLVNPDPVNLLRTCQPGTQDCSIAMCLPCYCAGLQATSAQHVQDSDWVQQARGHCGDYVQSSDASTALMRVVVALVIVVVNTTLRNLLTVLVKWEQHWTHSGEEKAYGVLSFASQALNTVVVPLLASMRLHAPGALQATEKHWYHTIALSGVHLDFSPFWYQDVGLILMLVTILNMVAPVVFAGIMWAALRLWRRCLVRYIKTAPQQSYNDAWAGPAFHLGTRVGNLLLMLTLVFTFSSGMPVLYVLGLLAAAVQTVLDRWLLTKQCQMPKLNDSQLPSLLLGILPWAAALHCAVGVWMHTYFDGGSSGGQDTFAAKQLGLGQLNWPDIWRRATQLNGVPLLTVLLILVAIYLLHRILTLQPIAALLRTVSGCSISHSSSSSSSSSSNPGDEPTTHGDGGHCGDADSITYEHAVVGAPGQRALLGTPTYQLTHHPHYKRALNNPIFKPLYLQTVCGQQFTRLVASSNGCWEVCPHPLLEHDPGMARQASGFAVASTQPRTPFQVFETEVEKGGGKKQPTAPGGHGIRVQVFAGEADGTATTPTVQQQAGGVTRVTRSPFDLAHSSANSPRASQSAAEVPLVREGLMGGMVHVHPVPLLSTASGQLVHLQYVALQQPAVGLGPMITPEQVVVDAGTGLTTAGPPGVAYCLQVPAVNVGMMRAGTSEVQGGAVHIQSHGAGAPAGDEEDEEDLCFASYPSTPVARSTQPSFSLGGGIAVSGVALAPQPSFSRQTAATAAAPDTAVGTAAGLGGGVMLVPVMAMPTPAGYVQGVQALPSGTVQRSMSPLAGSPRVTGSNLSRSSSMAGQHHAGVVPATAAAAAATSVLSRTSSASGAALRGTPAAATHPRSRVGAAAGAAAAGAGGVRDGGAQRTSSSLGGYAPAVTQHRSPAAPPTLSRAGSFAAVGLVPVSPRATTSTVSRTGSFTAGQAGTPSTIPVPVATGVAAAVGLAGSAMQANPVQRPGSTTPRASASRPPSTAGVPGAAAGSPHVTRSRVPTLSRAGSVASTGGSLPVVAGQQMDVGTACQALAQLRAAIVASEKVVAHFQQQQPAPQQ